MLEYFMPLGHGFYGLNQLDSQGQSSRWRRDWEPAFQQVGERFHGSLMRAKCCEIFLFRIDFIYRLPNPIYAVR